MSYKFLEHGGEEGILGEGKTREESFSEGAKALFATMIDIKNVEAKKAITIHCKANEIDLLFIEWLNELIAQRDLTDLIFSQFKVTIKEENKEFILIGKAYGEKMDIQKHKPIVEVKAATYSGLKVWKENNNYKVRCVLDV